MLAALNHLVEAVEASTEDDVDVTAVAAQHGTTEYHLRRMFSSLAGMPLSDYVRRRRMSRAATEVTGSDDDLLTIAVRHGYGSTEAFGRAFRAVHGITPGEARRTGGSFHSQQPLRFSLTVEGKDPMRVRITDQPDLRLVGHATRVPLIHEGTNPHIQEHVASIPVAEHLRLKEMSNATPAGLLQVLAETEPDVPEGTELTYVHGVAVTADTPVPDDLTAVDASAGAWAVFTSEGPHPQALQEMWAGTATTWFPSNPWRLRPGPSLVAVLDHAADWSSTTCELWLPVEREGSARRLQRARD